MSRKFHISLNVGSLERSLSFYRLLLGVDAVKVRPDYVKFELDDPPLVLSLIPGQPAASGHLNHAGIRVSTSAELVEVQRRLERAGIETEREDGVECCYALQTKFWAHDPDGARWEVYVFHEDVAHWGERPPVAGGVAVTGKATLNDGQDASTPVCGPPSREGRRSLPIAVDPRVSPCCAD